MAFIALKKMIATVHIIHAFSNFPIRLCDEKWSSEVPQIMVQNGWEYEKRRRVKKCNFSKASQRIWLIFWCNIECMWRYMFLYFHCETTLQFREINFLPKWMRNSSGLKNGQQFNGRGIFQDFRYGHWTQLSPSYNFHYES